MSDEIWITGLGLCSALGLSLAESWQGLLQGESGIRLQQPFSEQRAFPLGLVSDRPNSVNELLDLAWADLTVSASLNNPIGGQESAGIVVGSSRGYQAELEGLCQAAIWDPIELEKWQFCYGESPGRYLAEKLGLSGVNLSPRAACATGLWAIAQGMALIQQGICDQVLVGAVEAPVTPLTLAGFKKMGALSTQGAYPFDQNRDGFVLGEAAALLWLERRTIAEQRGVKPYAKLLGAGFGNDAYHRSAPHPQGAGAIAAVQQCLAKSDCSAEAIGYIHAHGTATAYNDQMEADLIQTLFPGQVAVSSTKGATGHTLGASGTIGAVFCALALQQQVLPPCVGLEHPAFPLNFVQKTQTASFRTALCLSFGFGGQNGAIALAAL